MLRRADRVRRGDRGDLAASHGADLRSAPDPGRDAVRVLHRPQDCGRRSQTDLPGIHDADAALDALDAFADSVPGRQYPSAVKTFRDAWERFIPFLAFPPELRRVIYTTNSIESLNYQLRKVTKNRGHFPNDQAAVKLLWMAICNIEDKRARERDKEKGLPAADRRAAGRLVEGAVTTNWKRALGNSH